MGTWMMALTEAQDKCQAATDGTTCSAGFEVFCRHQLTQHSQQPHEADMNILLVLQVGKPRHREVKQPAPRHTASKERM